MRTLSQLEIKRLKLLTERSVELCLIEPTNTGLKKSIMDATSTVRTFLKTNSIHDYGNQRQGPENKIQIPSFIIMSSNMLPSNCSLYRPNTKNGDPRIWFKGLGNYAHSNDIIGVIAFQKKLFVINISQLELEKLLCEKASNPLKDLINEICQIKNKVSEELLLLLKGIGAKGPIPACINADTAVGRTLESLLGININSSRNPDYKGIELKSFRDKRGNRKSLFAQVPNWAESKFKSSAEILNEFGYIRNNHFKLYCTVSAIVKNSQGLKLRLDNKLSQLIENSDKPLINDFAVWNLEILHQRLLEKHNETFWISADSKIIDGKEHFIYKEAEHTKKPIITQFDILLEQGDITLDHLIKKKDTGSVVEKGPIFKIKPKALDLLFPASIKYPLI